MHPASRAFRFQWKALRKLCQLLIEHAQGFAMTHVNIFTQIFKAGLARARHTPAESFLDTSYENVFFFQVSRKRFLRRIHIS